MTSSWPSGAVVKVLACHTGGREYESRMEQFFFFFFFYSKDLFLSSFHIQTSFFIALFYFSFSYLHNLDYYYYYYYFFKYMYILFK